jgi:hypothetical protein
MHLQENRLVDKQGAKAVRPRIAEKSMLVGIISGEDDDIILTGIGVFVVTTSTRGYYRFSLD